MEVKICVEAEDTCLLGSDAVGDDGRQSDTENLVKNDATSSLNNGASLTNGSVSPGFPSAMSQDPPQMDESFEHEVKFEDFECDVQVEGSESGEERKEFSFTFYDLDGHGKITKDDIAGLVRSIYGAVNDSITVPQGGKKTIKVKLTVTPESSNSANCPNGFDCANVNVDSLMNNNNVNKSNNDNVNDNNNNDTNNNNNKDRKTSIMQEKKNLENLKSSLFGSSKPKIRNNVNVTIQENLNRHRPSRRSTNKISRGGEHNYQSRSFNYHQMGDRPKFHSVRLPSSNVGCIGTGGGTHLSHCHECKNLSSEIYRDCSASPMRNRKKWKERGCSALQKGNLCELVENNMMDKSNLGCKDGGLPCSHSCCAPRSTTPTDQGANCTVLPLLNENVAKHDLLFSEGLFSHLSPHLFSKNGGIDEGGDQKCCHHHQVQNSHEHGGQQQVHHSHSHHRVQHHHSHTHYGRKHGHYRSRSHDVSQNMFKYHLLTGDKESSQVSQDLYYEPLLPSSKVSVSDQESSPRSPDLHEVLDSQRAASPPTNNKLEGGPQSTPHKNSNLRNQTAAPCSLSPHQMKHRNREQNHARSMAQVISWLEREHLGGVGLKKRYSSPTRKNLGGMPVLKNALFNNHVSPVTARKHEHHHVHEHIHHHYHHYAKETPIIV